MPAFGIIGYPLSHTFSPAYFEKKFADEGINATYIAYSLPDIKMFPSLLTNNPELTGLNVTIPHKEAIIPYLDELNPVAKKIGAVNTITISNGVKKGYNTDAIGFEQSLLPLLKPQHTRALVLGTGGASLAIAFVLNKLSIPFIRVSRIKRDDVLPYSELTTDTLQQHKLIINATPLGMYPLVDTYPPIDYSALSPDHLLYDLIYNPAETKFLALGKERGAAIKNGYEMLVLQAEAAWKIWNA